MPQPAQLAVREGALKIDSSFSVRIAGHTDRRLLDAVTRFTERVGQQTGIRFVDGRPVLSIEVRGPAPEVPALNEDESYQLEVTPTNARLTAPTTTGALRGMQTFLQLIAPGPDSFLVPALHIDDRPRFPWRGLMLDVARHWMPVPVIERNLEAMAAVKLNVFHWHLSDDQGIRAESKVYPKLQQLGSDGHYYTQADIRHVVAYAADRGIRVVPEFDIPGHTTSWFAGYPELASAPGPFQIERKWGIFEPTMDPTREEVYTFLDGFLGEMASLFPDEYFHIGGDEVVDTEWKSKGFPPTAELHAQFNRRIQALLKKHGKKMIGWDEVFHPGLANDAVIQSWRGPASLAEAARKGYRGILSFGYYLDHLKPAAFHYAIDPLGGEAGQLTAPEAARILGGEACMWTEYATDETVDSRIWPRAAAIAERLWSPREAVDVDSMYRRLATVSRWLDWTGVQHRSGYQRMLERLAGGEPVPALRVLADAVEALGIADRQSTRQYSSFVPLNRLADAARPESETVRRLNQIVDQKTDDAEAKLILTEWSANHNQLAPLFTGNFLLRELAGLSEDLSKTGTIGLQALQYLESGQRPPSDWLAEAKQELHRMEQPRAEVALAATRPVRALLDRISPPATPTGQARKPAINR
ncbi:MAG TPA: family 20 glycosylhydrolase [Bryobacteraceae bacterium]|nr:family 20 glycosylhydrolase [Bryobacteraceae bacterium]